MGRENLNIRRGLRRLCIAAAVVLGVASTSLAASGPAAAASDCKPLVGVNIISRGNSYAELEYRPEKIQELMAYFKQSGLSWVSVRVVWSKMEAQRGTLNQEYIAKLREFMEAAKQQGISVLLTFHTVFHADSFTIPPWWPNTGDYSLIQMVRNPDLGQAYINLLKGVSREVAGTPGLKAIAVMNEPYGRGEFGSAQHQNDYRAFDELFGRAAAAVRSAAPGVPVGIRFTSKNNPWATDPRKRFGEAAVLDAFDWVGLNNYVTEADDPIFLVLANAQMALRNANKRMWVTEFGSKAALDVQRDKIGRALNIFQDLDIDLALAWNWQSSEQENPFNLANPQTQQGTAAFEVMRQFARTCTISN